jgi:hypothetical protein
MILLSWVGSSGKNQGTVENSKNDCELQWAEIQSKNKSVIIGSYYRPPNSNLDALNNLKSSIANVSEHSKDKHVIQIFYS